MLGIVENNIMDLLRFLGSRGCSGCFAENSSTLSMVTVEINKVPFEVGWFQVAKTTQSRLRFLVLIFVGVCRDFLTSTRLGIIRWA